MTLVRLTAALRNEALAYQAKVLHKIRLYQPSYTGLETPNRYFEGKCGEIAVSLWATENKLTAICTSRDDGLSDKQDHLWLPHQQTSNVKNSFHPRAKKLLQPIAQADRYTYDFYIAAKSTDHITHVDVELKGACSQLYFERYANKEIISVPSLALLYENLPLNMEKFKTVIKKGLSPRPKMRGREIYRV